MPRKLLFLASAIVGAHLAPEWLLGPTPAGALVANSLQILARVIAAVMCFRTAYRGGARPLASHKY
ncbi:MAG: hypothetical protein WCE61_19745 [Candidatus Acidiferrum sp.]